MFTYPYKEKEAEELQRQLWLSQNDGSRMNLVYGKHGMGKSALVQSALSGQGPVVNLPLGGKIDNLALEEYSACCAKQLNIFVPYSIHSFEELLDFLFSEAWKKAFSLVLDNFQEAPKRYPTLCAHLAKKWRSEAKRTKMNLVLICGDLQAADSIFFADDAPLRNLPGATFLIEPVGLDLLKKIQQEAAPSALNREDNLAFYQFTGGRPEAVRLAIECGAVTKKKLLAAFLKEDSPLVRLCEKSIYSLLGKNSDTYLSILQLVATGVQSQAEMEQHLGGIIIGGHLAKLENEYQMLRKQRPLLSSPDSRGVVRYRLQNPGLNMYFRLRFANGGVSEENEASTILNNFLKDDLKEYLLEKISESGVFTTIGSDWAASARISKKKPASAKQVAGEEDVEASANKDIVALKGKKAMVAAVCPSEDAFNKEPFLKQIEALKKGPLKGYTIDARLFTIADV